MDAPLAIHRFNQALWIAERDHWQGIFSVLIAECLFQRVRIILITVGCQERVAKPSTTMG